MYSEPTNKTSPGNMCAARSPTAGLRDAGSSGQQPAAAVRARLVDGRGHVVLALPNPSLATHSRIGLSSYLICSPPTSGRGPATNMSSADARNHALSGKESFPPSTSTKPRRATAWCKAEQPMNTSLLWICRIGSRYCDSAATAGLTLEGVCRLPSVRRAPDPCQLQLAPCADKGGIIGTVRVHSRR